MANLKAIRSRISSVITTQQITKAMKLVAASKLKRAQDRILQMRPYSQKLNEILSNLSANLDAGSGLVYNKKREVNNVLLVVITSDKGLCGGFNSNIIKTTRRLLAEDYAQPYKAGNVTLLCIGKKGYDYFKKDTQLKIITDYVSILTKLTFQNSQQISEWLMKQYAEARYDVIELVYAQFKNAATQIFTVERFLPISTDYTQKTSRVKADYIFEPEKQKLLEELIPKILNTQFFKALLDSNASEHGARMVAMDTATNNANELIRTLRIVYNRERQASITKEILEIVGGAAALAEKS
ncbi:MAG: ATP synthase F1 subunit gamma [Chitinophagales bacterium]|nr:ATP synthase F1 subunit gamma [Chitinophagales bacterium]MDW8419272.1 ATP synthase F1 subunit gamma [Chitinophagales bacterium]